MVKYVYDAWGNHKVLNPNGTENRDATFIGNINPFRYRGYYYDTETELYYLQSRYYDPEIGRFITIDDISYADPETINGLNLYAYCLNNPIMYTDPTGNIIFEIIAGIIIVASLVATVNDIYQITSENVTYEVLDNDNDGVYEQIAINDGYKIITPWVQWGYSFSLNHIKDDTKNIIKGTTNGVATEWLAHNAAFHFLSLTKLVFPNSKKIDAYMKAVNPTNIGGTVFSNGKSSIGTGLKIFSAIVSPITTLIDFFCK